MDMTLSRLAAPDGISLALLELDSVTEASLLLLLTLSSEEQHRLAGLKNLNRRRDWLAGRWLARQLLAELSAQPFTISAGDEKPLVKSGSPLFCNWSHSHGWLLAAATKSGPIGCDIERCKPRPRLESIIQKSFAADEAATLLAMDTEPRQQAFFELWTLKESALKADGIGIGAGLKSPEFKYSCDWNPVTDRYTFHSGEMSDEHDRYLWATAWEPQITSAD